MPAAPARLAATGPEPSVAPPARQAPLVTGRVLRGPLVPLAIGTHPGGVDGASWRRFRTGKLQAVRTLDLHGRTAQRAFQALTTFLRAAHAEGVRCVEVVTGQGGVLRRELPLWLNLPELRGVVLAAAHPHPANPGSVRLLSAAGAMKAEGSPQRHREHRDSKTARRGEAAFANLCVSVLLTWQITAACGYFPMHRP